MLSVRLIGLDCYANTSTESMYPVDFGLTLWPYFIYSTIFLCYSPWGKWKQITGKFCIKQRKWLPLPLSQLSLFSWCAESPDDVEIDVDLPSFFSFPHRYQPQLLWLLSHRRSPYVGIDVYYQRVASAWFLPVDQNAMKSLYTAIMFAAAVFAAPSHDTNNCHNNVDTVQTYYDGGSASPRIMACYWEGTAPFCNGSCKPGWTTTKHDRCGDGKCCSTGKKALCCRD